MTVSRGRRAAVVVGLASLAAAVVAVVTDQGWLVILAAVLAGTCVALVSLPDRGRRRQGDAPSTVGEAATGVVDEPAHDEARPVPERVSTPTGAGPPAPPEPAAPEPEGSEQEGPDHQPLGRPQPGDRTTTSEPEVDLRDHKAATSCVTDSETGLFNQLFFDTSLVKRVSAARRGLRPLSVAVADVVARASDTDITPGPAAEVGRIMLAVLREADLAARADDGRYLVLLEDTPETGAVWTLERLRRRIVEDLPGHTVWVGVSCYPAYGFNADQLVGQARRALDAAREWHQDRIEVTSEDPDD